MSKNQAEFYSLEPWPIEVGGAADLVIFDPDKTWKVEGFVSKSDNSPFLGWELPGEIKYTICGGMIVYRNA